MAVHFGISKARNAQLPLTTVENHIFFVEAFDSYFVNDGFDGFIANARSTENVEDYIRALNALGLSEIVKLIEEGESKYSELDRENEHLWGVRPDSELSAKYLEVSRDITARIYALGVDIEDAIERYVDLHYPWRQA